MTACQVCSCFTDHALVLLWLLAPVLVACSASEQDIALLRYTLSVQLYFV